MNASENSQPRTKKKINVILIGPTGSGKSAFGNAILGSEIFLESPSAQSVTQGCQIGKIIIPVREDLDLELTVMDTEGIFDTNGHGVDTMKNWLHGCEFHFSSKIHIIFLVLSGRLEMQQMKQIDSEMRRAFTEAYYDHVTIIRTNSVLGQNEQENEVAELKEIYNSHDSNSGLRKLFCEQRKFFFFNNKPPEEGEVASRNRRNFARTTITTYISLISTTLQTLGLNVPYILNSIDEEERMREVELQNLAATNQRRAQLKLDNNVIVQKLLKNRQADAQSIGELQAKLNALGDNTKYSPEQSNYKINPLIKAQESLLKCVPEQILSSNMCFLAVKTNGWGVKYVPEYYFLDSLYDDAVKSNGLALELVPTTPVDKLTSDQCFNAVSTNGMALCFVPSYYMCEKMCRIAVQSNGLALGAVPKSLINLDIIVDAVKSNGIALQYVPDMWIVPEICSIAVKSNGEALQFVPDEYKTQEILENAVNSNGLALAFVEESKITPELKKKAVQSNGLALKFLNSNEITPELCKIAVDSNGLALEFVPNNLITPELCDKAVKKNGIALEFVPSNLKIDSVCMQAVKNNGIALEFVPNNLKTEPLVQAAITSNGWSIKFLPPSFEATYDLWMQAIKTAK